VYGPTYPLSRNVNGSGAGFRPGPRLPVTRGPRNFTLFSGPFRGLNRGDPFPPLSRGTVSPKNPKKRSGGPRGLRVFLGYRDPGDPRGFPPPGVNPLGSRYPGFPVSGVPGGVSGGGKPEKPPPGVTPRGGPVTLYG